MDQIELFGQNLYICMSPNIVVWKGYKCDRTWLLGQSHQMRSTVSFDHGHFMREECVTFIGMTYYK